MTLHHLGSLVVSASVAEAGMVLPLMDNNSFRLCSLLDIAGLRIFQTMLEGGEGDVIFDDGPILTRNAVLCFPGNPPTAKLVKNSPLLLPSPKYVPEKGIVLESAKIVDERTAIGATKAEAYTSLVRELEKTNFFPSKEQREISLENSVDFPVSEKVGAREFVELKDFRKEKLIPFMFGINVEMYAKSLEKSRIKGIMIYPEFSEAINEFDKPFVKQIVYGRDGTADISIHSTILFANKIFYIFGIKV
jgi:hypothetical protein